MKRKGYIGVGLLAGCIAAAVVAAHQRAIPRSHDRDGEDGRWGHLRRVSPVSAVFPALRGAIARRQGPGDRRRSLADQLVAAVGVYATLAAVWLSLLSLDVIDDVLGFFSSVTGAIRQAIHDAVNWVYHEAIKIGQDIISWAGELIYSVAVLARQLVGDLSTWAQEAVYGVAVLARSLVSDATGFLEGLIDDARNFASAAIGAAFSLLQGAISDVANLANWVWHTLVDPLYQWITHAADFVSGVIAGWWDTIYNDVIGPLLHLADDAWHKIDDVYDWLVNEVRPAWAVIVGAWDWLVYMAEHSFSTVEAVLHSARQPGVRFQQVVSSAEAASHLDLFGEYVDKVLS